MPRVSTDGLNWIECNGRGLVEPHWDDVEIQAALNSLPVTGGTVYLSSGTFQLAKQIARAIDDVTIRGMGKNTLINFNASTPVISAGAQDGWSLLDFDTDAGGIDTSTATSYETRVYRQGYLICGTAEVSTITGLFTQTVGKNAYAMAVVIPAGSVVLDVRWMNEAVWTDAGGALANVGDVDDPDGYIDAVDVTAAPIADVAGAGGISSFLKDTGTGAYKGLTKYYAADQVLTASVLSVATTGHTGISRVIIVYAKPTNRPATMASV